MSLLGSNNTKNFDESLSFYKGDLSDLGKKVFNSSYSKKKELRDYNLSDLNNYLGSDRKLIINDTNEFWVHDLVLISNSNYFKNLLQLGTIHPQKTEEILIEGHPITKTFITLPHSEYFFDILTWIYSKDINRLCFIADDQESYLSILSLGIFLGLSKDFFMSLINNCEMKLDESLINSELWSRFQFPFDVLINLIDLIDKENESLKFFALLNWLKEGNNQNINFNENENENIDKINEINELEELDIDKSEFELLTSDDYFKVKEYIKNKNICENLSITDLNKVKTDFPKLLPILDINLIIDKYVQNNNVKITCRICKLQSNQIKTFENVKCQEKLYHPRKFIQLQRQISGKCNHSGCNKKIVINEFPCCHQQNLGEGCLMSDGNHILSIH